MPEIYGQIPPTQAATATIAHHIRATPTATTPYPTTCYVYSVPKSQYVFSYTSGETAYLKGSHYTADYFSTKFYTGSVTAGCFSAKLPAVYSDKLVAVCSTTTYPASSWTRTLSHPLLRSTTLTTTGFNSESTSVSCKAVPEYTVPETCNSVSPLTWIAFILTFISVQLSWWMFDLPLLFKKRTEKASASKEGVSGTNNNSIGSRISDYTTTVLWACLRMHCPTMSVYLSLGANTIPDISRCYHLGTGSKSNNFAIPQWTRRKYATSLLTNLLGLAATILTIYQAGTVSQYDTKWVTSGTWVFPSLPSALFGIILMIAAKFPQLQRLKPATVVILALACSAITVCLVITLLLWRFLARDSFWLPTLLFVVMMIPWHVIHLYLLLAATALGVYSRVGGITIAALDHISGGQPFCLFYGNGFAWVYLSMGIIAGLLSVAALVILSRHHSGAKVFNRRIFSREA